MINRDAGIRPKPSPRGNHPRQAGLCNRNRQNKVNAMLTIVINLRFTQIGTNRLPLTKKGGLAASLASSRRRGELKRVALNRIQATRFKSLFLCMSLSQNRCTLLVDMH
ncbi:hypothetical protein ACWGS9_01470 [Bradyrhizobium sp. Arg314]